MKPYLVKHEAICDGSAQGRAKASKKKGGGCRGNRRFPCASPQTKDNVHNDIFSKTDRDVMMDKMVTFAIATTIAFAVLKFVEMKFIDKEVKPLKYFVRDVILVFASSLFAAFVLLNYGNTVGDFMNVVTDSKVIPSGPVEVFTELPGF
jgi:hypothetical protein